GGVLIRRRNPHSSIEERISGLNGPISCATLPHSLRIQRSQEKPAGHSAHDRSRMDHSMTHGTLIVSCITFVSAVLGPGQTAVAQRASATEVASAAQQRAL